MRENSFVQWLCNGLVPKQVSVGFVLLLPVIIPILILRLVCFLIVTVLTLVVAMAYPGAVRIVLHKVHAATITADTDSNSAQLKGEEWQRGNQQRGSLIRSGGSLNSDDLRHRLNELRSSKSGGPERRTPKTGGHYAKQ